MTRALRYKIADNGTEFEAIHRLNHRTFAQEIPQHAVDPRGRLVDRFHTENTYAVCLDDAVLVAMVAGRASRPFSLDGKLDDLDRYLPPGRRPVEIRLLAVDPAYRRGGVMARLVGMISEHFAERGCDLAVISGTIRALPMYRRMGFVPFGPLTGPPQARFQPMYLTTDSARHTWWATGADGSQPVNLLPGPVEVAPEVAAALARPAVYHRCDGFRADLAKLHGRLAAFTGAAHAQVLVGSGTLANDVVAAQLNLLDRPGLVLSNGEFGERLVDHATRTGLAFEVFDRPWGEGFDAARVAERIRHVPAGGWVWAVHCETSTGTLLDLPSLAAACAAGGVRLAVDCISSIGTVPLDLSGVDFATAASGKALGAYPGLSVVLTRHRPVPAPTRIPRYLDLGLYAAQDGVAFTHSSNLVAALTAAMEVTDWPERYARMAAAGAWLRAQLTRRGFTVIATDGHAAPGVVTVEPPAPIDAGSLGAALGGAGFLLGYSSCYLRRRNWLQVALMGRWTWPALRGLIQAVDAAVDTAAVTRGPVAPARR